MMYSNKLATAIKVNGKILREFKDQVLVPFGSEYSILLKNLNTVRAVVYVFIDGENVVPGGLVLNVGQEIDLERSIKNGNLSEGNKFKFIERTGAVEKHRGIKLEDGIVRIEYNFERIYRPSVLLNEPWQIGTCFGSPTVGSPNILRGISVSDSTTYSSVASSVMTNNMSVSATSYKANDAGITVPGSKSEQSFKTTSGFTTEMEKHSMVIKLLGETADNKTVFEPVTVKHKPKCVTCGKQNKATSKFCTECGTALEIFA